MRNGAAAALEGRDEGGVRARRPAPAAAVATPVLGCLGGDQRTGVDSCERMRRPEKCHLRQERSDLREIQRRSQNRKKVVSVMACLAWALLCSPRPCITHDGLVNRANLQSVHMTHDGVIQRELKYTKLVGCFSCVRQQCDPLVFGLSEPKD